MASDVPLLSLDLQVDYPNKPQALRAVSLQINHGEVLGLVGESGSGKSTIALAILRLLHLKGGRASGHIWFRGHDLMMLSEREMRRVRGREISLVLQSPLASLNPALKIGTQLAEAWKAHAAGTKAELATAVNKALSSVGLPPEQGFSSRHPSQVSVGQAQRVLIAMAVMHSPALLIADEPTSALDAITQADIIKLFTDLKRRTGSALLYISHDLSSVATICDHIAILHHGEIVECGTVESVLTRPVHPYTQQLLASGPLALRSDITSRLLFDYAGKASRLGVLPIARKPEHLGLSTKL